jgi:hypothetical protein
MPTITVAHERHPFSAIHVKTGWTERLRAAAVVAVMILMLVTVTGVAGLLILLEGPP